MDITYASAGSGKTFELAKTFIQRVLDGENPSNIFCLTFTKKATAEIKERVVIFAQKLIARDIEFLTIFGKDKISNNEISLLKNIDNNRLQIFTIDSFLFKILKFISLDTKRLAEDEEMFSIVEEAKFKFALNNMKINKENFEELLYILKGIYISKRSAMIKMLKDNQKQTLFDLFKYKDLDKKKLSERIYLKLYDYNLIEDNTWTEENIIEKFINSKYMNKKFYSLNLYNLKNLKYEQKEELKKVVLYIKAFYFIQSSNMRLSDLFDNFKIFEDIVENIKKERKIIDYNDVLINLNDLLDDEENKEIFDYYIFNNIGHLLVDEYQDTSSYQDFILEIIFKSLRDGANAVSTKPSLFLVGDIKQSIYEWRDADSKIFLAKEEYLKKESYLLLNGLNEVEKEHLVVEDTFIENYSIHKIKRNNTTRRLHPNIVEELNKKFKDKELVGFQPHISFREDIETESIYEELEVSDNVLIDNIISKIQELINKGKEYKDICVLTRNNDVLNELESQIKHLELTTNLKIPTKKDNGGLSESFEVKFINNILLSVFAIDNSLYIKRVLEHLLEFNDELYDYFINNNSTKEIRYIISKIESLRNNNISMERKLFLIIEEMELYNLIFKVRGSSSVSVLNRYFEYLLKNIKYLRNENELVERIIAFTHNKNLNLDINEEVNAVHLLTVHKAKGLEFDTVLLIEKDMFREMLNGIKITTNGTVIDLGKNKLERPTGYKDFEDKYNLYKEEEIQSQLRLYYVAFTRSKNNLYVFKSESTV